MLLVQSLLTINNQNWISTVYLITNCGIDLLNEIWTYNIAADKWTYIKPYYDSNLKIQPKPSPRYGHSAVYVEKLDNSDSTDAVIVRKFMFIYGGFSIYCENACDDFWMYEIAYAPIRYYPSSSDTLQGNIWTRLISTGSNSPGKRIFHSMVVDKQQKYIYLYGGMCLDKDNKYYINNDLWRYDIAMNSWDIVYMMGVSQIKRTVIIHSIFIIFKFL